MLDSSLKHIKLSQWIYSDGHCIIVRVEFSVSDFLGSIA